MSNEKNMNEQVRAMLNILYSYTFGMLFSNGEPSDLGVGDELRKNDDVKELLKTMKVHHSTTKWASIWGKFPVQWHDELMTKLKDNCKQTAQSFSFAVDNAISPVADVTSRMVSFFRYGDVTIAIHQSGRMPNSSSRAKSYDGTSQTTHTNIIKSCDVFRGLIHAGFSTVETSKTGNTYSKTKLIPIRTNGAYDKVANELVTKMCKTHLIAAGLTQDLIDACCADDDKAFSGESFYGEVEHVRSNVTNAPDITQIVNRAIATLQVDDDWPYSSTQQTTSARIPRSGISSFKL